MNTNGYPHVDEPNIAASISGLAHDAIELSELQAALFVCDVKRSGRTARTALLCAAVGLCLLLGSIPIALIALAELLNYQFDWTPAAGYVIATVVGLAISATAFGLAYARIKNGIVALDRSREELNQNIAWLKRQLSKSRDRGSGVPTF